MKDNLTELVFILDRSGSMGGLESDTINGYNSFIERQKSESGEVTLTTVLFDNMYELLHTRADIRSISPLTEHEYYVRGTTALLDAIGKSIDMIGRELNCTPEHLRPSKVVFVITTDGMENASRHYTVARVREMIEHQKSKYSWEFLFLGANIDAISTANTIGISRDRAVKFAADHEGVAVNFDTLSNTIACYRACNTIDSDWKADIENNLNSSEQKKKKVK